MIIKLSNYSERAADGGSGQRWEWWWSGQPARPDETCGRGDIMARLAGKVAVVTGGNSGIGLATAKRFREEGARVVISGRDQKTLDEAVKTIGGDVVAVRADVSKLSDLDKLYKTVADKFGKIDVLFANAGIAKFAPVADSGESLFDEQFDVNVKGVYFTIQKALPLLNDGASIIINSSVVNETGIANGSVYAATKAAVRSFARTLTVELVERGMSRQCRQSGSDRHADRRTDGTIERPVRRVCQ